MSGWLLLAVVLLGATLVGEPPPRPGLPVAILAATAFTSEMAALWQPGWGFYSLAAASYLALAALNPAAAALLAVATIGLRSLIKGAPTVKARAAESLADLLPVLATAAGCRLLDGWIPTEVLLGVAGLEIYIPLALLLPLRQADPEVRRRMAPLVVLASLLAPPALVLLKVSPWHMLWMAIPAMALAYAAEAVLRHTQPRDRGLLEYQLEQANKGLEQSQLYQARLASELKARAHELVLLRELAKALARSPSLSDTADLVLRMIEQLVPDSNVAFFQRQEGELVAVAARGPHSHTALEARLLKLSEPAVEAAWRESRPVLLQPRESARLFPEDPFTAALPLEKLGVFYVGARELSEEQLQLLALLTAQASLSLHSADRFESQQEALEAHSRAHARLEEWAQHVGRLLESARQVASTLDFEGVQAGLWGQLSDLVPVEGVLLVSPDLEVCQGAAGPSWRAVAEVVQQNALPLLLKNVEESRFGDLGVRSLLAVPLMYGALIVGGSEPYRRLHQDLLYLFALQVEAALRNVRLHADVLEAYRKLQESEAQLVQSSKIAAVGQLAAGVAHELNTPLGAVLLGLDSAMKAVAENDRAVARLEKARRAAQRAKDIVSKLLYYTREGKLEDQPVNLPTVVTDTLEFLSYHLREAGIQVETDTPPVPAVRGNQHDLQQVVTNLVLNARDAMQNLPPDRRRLVVRTRAEGDEVQVEVEDSGSGMRPEVLERIFEPFFTTKEVGVGTGLGLSVSQQIVARHGGRLEAGSQPGEGSCFRMTLPRME